MLHQLSGGNYPKLHLVAFKATRDVQTALRDLATESHGHYHKYSSSVQQLPPDEQHTEGHTGDNIGSEARAVSESAAVDHVEDSDVNFVKEEIAKIQRLLADIESMSDGFPDSSLLKQLQEVLLRMY